MPKAAYGQRCFSDAMRLAFEVSELLLQCENTIRPIAMLVMSWLQQRR